MERYVKIRTLRKILAEHYQSCHQKMSFDQALSDAVLKGLYEPAAPSPAVRTNRILKREEFIDMIDDTPVEAEVILHNPQKNVISEEHIIPEQRLESAVQILLHSRLLTEGNTFSAMQKVHQVAGGGNVVSR